MGKVSFELSIGYQKKKKKKKKKLRTRSNVRAKIKYIDIRSIWISLGKSEKGPMTIKPEIERRKIERDTVYVTDNIQFGNPDYDTCVY